MERSSPILVSVHLIEIVERALELSGGRNVALEFGDAEVGRTGLRNSPEEPGPIFGF